MAIDTYNQKESSDLLEIDLNPTFFGPLDLLLSLITKHELDIVEVSLVKVTDEFIEKMQEVISEGEFDPESLSEFLLIASTLLSIKTRALLPKPEIDLESELSFINQKDLLLARLMQYKAFKDLSLEFKERLENGKQFYKYIPAVDEENEERKERLKKQAQDLQITVTKDDLLKIALDIFKEKKVNIEHMTYVNVSIEDELNHIKPLIRSKKRITFKELVEDAPDITHVIVRFLALLSMFKEQDIMLRQDKSFSELEIIAL